MIEFIFTLDYEIYGNGEGRLQDLVLDPSQRLAEVFQEYSVPFVVFAEAVEFAKMEQFRSDPDTSKIRADLRGLRAAGHEIALHIHPWWANAKFENGQWELDWSERNICTLNLERVEAIVSGAIQYLRDALNDPIFTPVSFRSGLWAMQPSTVIADVLTRHGIRVDSSVFKGGKINALGLDYRAALGNGEFWRFDQDVNVPNDHGALLEIPIHTRLVPFWQMMGWKRLRLQKKVPTGNVGPLPRRWRDLMRLLYPRKLDFCRMTFQEMREDIEIVLKKRRDGQDESGLFVAIGHSKDCIDTDAIRNVLDFLRQRRVPITTFSRVLSRELQRSKCDATLTTGVDVF